jgi:hypothetical protein
MNPLEKAEFRVSRLVYLSRFSITRALLTIIVSLADISPGVADDTENSDALQRFAPTGRHRVDVSYTRYEASVGDVEQFLAAYVWAPRRDIRLSMTGSVVTNFGNQSASSGAEDNSGDTGIGDTLIGIQFDPSENLAASPWIPQTIGFNAQVLVPTGNGEKGLGSDAWMAIVGAGWAIESAGHLWLVPAVGYEFTFNESSQATPVNEPFASIDIVWFFDFGVWVGVTPRIGYEFEEDQLTSEYTLTLGKMFQRGFGMSFDYGSAQPTSSLASRDDRHWLLNFYYQFGRPSAATGN